MDLAGEDRTFRRTIALLVSLAALAERAAGRSLPVRWFVLVLLRYAERAARDFLVDETGWEWHVIEDAFGMGAASGPGAVCLASDGFGNGPADALALARRLRALAALLRTFLPPDDLSGHADTRAGTVVASRGLASSLARLLAGLSAAPGPRPTPPSARSGARVA